MHGSAISLLYENRRSPTAQPYDKVVKYMDAVERAAAGDAKDVADALADLETFRTKAPTEFADAPPGLTSGFRSKAEVSRILAERDAAER